jgi:hypothetical protein
VPGKFLQTIVRFSIAGWYKRTPLAYRRLHANSIILGLEHEQVPTARNLSIHAELRAGSETVFVFIFAQKQKQFLPVQQKGDRILYKMFFSMQKARLSMQIALFQIFSIKGCGIYKI